MTKTLLAILTLAAFLITSVIGPLPQARAEEFYLPAPGVMVHLSPPRNPPLLKGIKVHPDNPFRFDFILDVGDGSKQSLNGQVMNLPLQQEATKLIKYFLASLTVPEKDLWVNLSPYEKDRIIPNSFGLTEMGRDLLAEDYMLKQITASLIYPEDEIGKKFWKRVYQEAAKKFGTTDIPVNTFNKVWIVPDKAVVYENAKAGTAYVVESKLKVMLEQDYLALEKNQTQTRGHVPEGAVSPSPLPNELGLNAKAPQGNNRTTSENVSVLGSQIVREIVIPELTTEVNGNKNFSKLRQVYNSLILATWYKKKIKDSILEQVYADKNKVAGVNIDDPLEKQRIYERYLRAFKKGVFNYIKEDKDILSQETIPRKYFSGGVVLSLNGNTDLGHTPLVLVEDPAMVSGNPDLLKQVTNEVVVGAGLREPNGSPIFSSTQVPVMPVQREDNLSGVNERQKQMLNIKRQNQALQERARVLKILPNVQNFVTGSALVRLFPKHTLDRIRNVEIVVADDVPYIGVIFHREEFKSGRPVIIINAELVRKATDAQLAFIIGHELGHLLLEHVNDVIEANNNHLLTKELAYEIEKRADVVGIMAAIKLFGQKEASMIPGAFDIFESIGPMVKQSQEKWGLSSADPVLDPHMSKEQRKIYLDMIRNLLEGVVDSADRMKFLNDTFDAAWPEGYNEAIQEALVAQFKKHTEEVGEKVVGVRGQSTRDRAMVLDKEPVIPQGWTYLVSGTNFAKSQWNGGKWKELLDRDEFTINAGGLNVLTPEQRQDAIEGFGVDPTKSFARIFPWDSGLEAEEYHQRNRIAEIRVLFPVQDLNALAVKHEGHYVLPSGKLIKLAQFKEGETDILYFIPEHLLVHSDHAMIIKEDLWNALSKGQNIKFLMKQLESLGYKENVFKNFKELTVGTQVVGVYVIPDNVMKLYARMTYGGGNAVGEGAAFSFRDHIVLDESTVEAIEKKEGGADKERLIALHRLWHERAHSEYYKAHPDYNSNASEEMLVNEIYAHLEGFIKTYGREGLFEKREVEEAWGQQDWFDNILLILESDYLKKDAPQREEIVARLRFTIDRVRAGFLESRDPKQDNKIMAGIKQSKSLDDLGGIDKLGASAINAEDQAMSARELAKIGIDLIYSPIFFGHLKLDYVSIGVVSDFPTLDHGAPFHEHLSMLVGQCIHYAMVGATYPGSLIRNAVFLAGIKIAAAGVGAGVSVLRPKPDNPMAVNGGIDLSSANMHLQTRNTGEGIKFRLDPAMLAQLQNAPGFEPVIINIQPLKSLTEFLGLNQVSADLS